LDFYVNEKNCSLSTAYNGDMIYRKPQNNDERWSNLKQLEATCQFNVIKHCS